MVDKCKNEALNARPQTPQNNIIIVYCIRDRLSILKETKSGFFWFCAYSQKKWIMPDIISLHLNSRINNLILYTKARYKKNPHLQAPQVFLVAIIKQIIFFWEKKCVDWTELK